MSKCDSFGWCVCDECQERRHFQHLEDIKKWQEKYTIETLDIKPHEQDCDVFLCQEEICFKYEPDKIVGEPYDHESYRNIGWWGNHWKNLNYQSKNLDIE